VKNMVVACSLALGVASLVDSFFSCSLWMSKQSWAVLATDKHQS